VPFLAVLVELLRARAGASQANGDERRIVELAADQRPAERVEILGDAPDTPLRASLVERGRRLAATPFLASTIDDHLHGLTGEDVPQVCVPRRFLAPHYDQQTSHTPSPVDHQPETVNRVLGP